jgi:hypothetical protein
MAISERAPKFTDLPSAICLAIKGPSFHVHFIVGIHEQEIKVATDDTTIA